MLVIHHRRLGTWLPLGGELEAGETPLEAAARELREETGLEGRFAPLRGRLRRRAARLHRLRGAPGGRQGPAHELRVRRRRRIRRRRSRPTTSSPTFRWVERDEILALDSPLNVREFGFLALDAEVVPD